MLQCLTLPQSGATWESAAHSPSGWRLHPGDSRGGDGATASLGAPRTLLAPRCAGPTQTVGCSRPTQGPSPIRPARELRVSKPVCNVCAECGCASRGYMHLRHDLAREGCRAHDNCTKPAMFGHHQTEHNLGTNPRVRTSSSETWREISDHLLHYQLICISILHNFQPLFPTLTYL
jgi:hypothetical protein